MLTNQMLQPISLKRENIMSSPDLNKTV